jgi:hypothetical protein
MIGMMAVLSSKLYMERTRKPSQPDYSKIHEKSIKHHIALARHFIKNLFPVTDTSGYTALVHSPQLSSWIRPTCRTNLNVPIEIWPVPSSVHKLCRRVLDSLELEMGIIDLKETPDGELVWLEVNPQGQFLFWEPICDLKIGDIFVEYLLEAVNTL